MSDDNLGQLARLIESEKTSLLQHWRQLVKRLPSAQGLDIPTLNDHIPALLDELAVAFDGRDRATITETLLDGTPPAHGLQRVQDGFDINEVVAEYNILRGCIHDLADRHGLRLQGEPFHRLNQVLDAAIGLAVQTYATRKALEVQQRREEYLAFVAHDLRTPLNAISLATRVLELTANAAPQNVGNEKPQMLKALRRNVSHLEELVANIIKENTGDLESGLKLHRRRFDLWPLIEGLRRDLEPVAQTNNTQVTNTIAEDFTLVADASLLRRVFQNLIANAITYTPRGEVIIGAKELQDGCECWVTDNGAGIPAERLATIFEPLETDPDKDGIGLGLAIVKRFVEDHGGTVEVSSAEGDGSMFRFTLPYQAR